MKYQQDAKRHQYHWSMQHHHQHDQWVQWSECDQVSVVCCIIGCQWWSCVMTLNKMTSRRTQLLLQRKLVDHDYSHWSGYWCQNSVSPRSAKYFKSEARSSTACHYNKRDLGADFNSILHETWPCFKVFKFVWPLNSSQQSVLFRIINQHLWLSRWSSENWELRLFGMV